MKKGALNFVGCCAVWCGMDGCMSLQFVKVPEVDTVYKVPSMQDLFDDLESLGWAFHAQGWLCPGCRVLVEPLKGFDAASTIKALKEAGEWTE